ncbi:MAG: hypothetical protein ACI4SD_01605 [Suilimivivens sp.]
MESTIYQIYDKIFKKVLTLSSLSVVNLINGLFGTDYPKDSTVSYNWTEFEKEDLRKILADTILTINGKYSYHMEAQMDRDNAIILRVFDYGYNHALRSAKEENGIWVLEFPEPKIIYLYAEKDIPDEFLLQINFGTQGKFIYRVTTFKYQEVSTEELNERKMVILIPFKLLKLRKLLEKDRSKENLFALKNLIQNDIIGSIEENLAMGNITFQDAQKLKRYTHKLYEHIYAHYKEMEELNEMTDESLMLDIDIIEKRHETELYEIKEKFKEKLTETENALTETENALIEKQNDLEKAESEIARLKKLLENAGISS